MAPHGMWGHWRRRVFSPSLPMMGLQPGICVSWLPHGAIMAEHVILQYQYKVLLHVSVPRPRQLENSRCLTMCMTSDYLRKQAVMSQYHLPLYLIYAILN